MGLVVFKGPESFTLFAVKLNYFSEQKHHEFVRRSHSVFLEANSAFVGLLLFFCELLEAVLAVPSRADGTFKNLCASWNHCAGGAFVILRLVAEFGLWVEVSFCELNEL